MGIFFAEQEERDLAPVLRLMDGLGLSHRLAAICSCVLTDAQQRVAVRSRISRTPSTLQRPGPVRQPPAEKHLQRIAAPTTQQHLQATAQKPLLPGQQYYQEAVAAIGTKPEARQQRPSSSHRREQREVTRAHAPMEVSAEPPSATALAEAHADASEAELSQSFEQGCKLPRTQADWMVSAERYAIHCQSQCTDVLQLRRSQRLQEAVQRAAPSMQLPMPSNLRQMSMTQQLQAEVARAGKRAR